MARCTVLIRMGKLVSLVSGTVLGFLGVTAARAVAAQTPPTAQISNGRIQATVYLPDAKSGFYRGTRFDWAGMIGKLTADGHIFYDQWFTRTDPNGRDFIDDGQNIVAGPASSAMGIPEEFTGSGGVPLNYAEAPVGGTFIKIGVGILRKPDEPKYSEYTHYTILDGGKRTIKQTKDSITFTQDLIDSSTGYGYLYTKTIRLTPGKPELLLEHTLKNTGRKAIETLVYDHNFLTLDHLPPGPDFTVKTPFTITPTHPINEQLGYVQGNTIGYKKVLAGQEKFTVAIGGYGTEATDYDFTVSNAKAKASVRIQGDQPLHSASLWSMRATLAVEPYIRLAVQPGQEAHWTYTYTYSAAGR